MLPYWDSVIRPFLMALESGPILEIGSARGETTIRLAELASERGFALHAVDPAPQFDVNELRRTHGEHFVFHKEKSHSALGAIGPVTAALIDGDHNWYTVHGELTQLERIARGAGCPLPLVIAHDVEWPYARRDMYHDPESIPQRQRQPWRRQGIRWGQQTLDENGKGINAHLANAVQEGGARNGVLTAIEDFLTESAASPELRIVPGQAGLGFVVTPELLAAMPEVRAQWDRLLSPDFLREHMQTLSRELMRLTAPKIEAVQSDAVER